MSWPRRHVDHYTAVMVNNFRIISEKAKHKFEVGRIGNRYAIVNKIAGNTFRSLKKYEKKTGTMLYYVIVD